MRICCEDGWGPSSLSLTVLLPGDQRVRAIVIRQLGLQLAVVFVFERERRSIFCDERDDSHLQRSIALLLLLSPSIVNLSQNSLTIHRHGCSVHHVATLFRQICKTLRIMINCMINRFVNRLVNHLLSFSLVCIHAAYNSSLIFKLACGCCNWCDFVAVLLVSSIQVSVILVALKLILRSGCAEFAEFRLFELGPRN